MNLADFEQVARLGMTAHACRAWEEPIRGRIVALTKPRYGAYIRDAETGEVRYADCTWINRIEVQA